MSALSLWSADAFAASRVLNERANALITASVALGYTLTEWTYHAEWEANDIWPRILFPFLAWLTATCTAAWRKVGTLGVKKQPRHRLSRAIGADRRKKTGGADNSASPSESATASASVAQSEAKSVPEWALRTRPLLPSRTPLNGPEWAYVVARIGSIASAASSLAIYTVGSLNPPDRIDLQPRYDDDHWRSADRYCNAAFKLTAFFNLLALSGSSAIMLVRALALHKFDRPLEKPILWLLWGCLQTLILLEGISSSAVSPHDGSGVCQPGNQLFHVPFVVILLPYFLPILSSSLCFILIGRYIMMYRRTNPEAWRASWTFRLYLRDSFQLWLLTIGLFLPLLIVFIVQSVTLPLYRNDWSFAAGPPSDIKAVVERWRLTAILNLGAPCTAAYACRIFVNLRRCLEHDLGGAAAAGMGATAYDYNGTSAGGGGNGMMMAGAASGLRSRQGYVPSNGVAPGVWSGAGWTGGAAAYPYPFPHFHFYQHPAPGNGVPVAARLPPHALARSAHATASQPAFSQVARAPGIGETMSTSHAPTPNWAGGPMGTSSGFGLGSAVGPGGTLRFVRRPSVSNLGPTTTQNHQPAAVNTTAEGTSQVQFQLPGLHHHLPYAGPIHNMAGDGTNPTPAAGDDLEKGEEDRQPMYPYPQAYPYPQMYFQPVMNQQQQAAMTGSFIQAMNASGMPYQLQTNTTAPSIPPAQAPLPERQLVVVQEDWGDTHPDLVFSLNGGLDEEEEELEDMQRRIQQQQQLGMTPIMPNGGGGAVPVGNGQWLLPAHSLGLASPSPVVVAGPASSSLAAAAVYAMSPYPSAGAPLPTTFPHGGHPTLTPPFPSPASPHSGSMSAQQAAASFATQTATATPATSAEAAAAAAVAEAGDDGEAEMADDESWMHHPEECECDGCCETDTEASDYERPVADGGSAPASVPAPSPITNPPLPTASTGAGESSR